MNTNTLTIINLQPEDAGNYRCVATNDCGTNYSNYAAISLRGKEALCLTIILVIYSKVSSTTIITKQITTFTCFDTGYNVCYKWTIGLFPSEVTSINTNQWWI